MKSTQTQTARESIAITITLTPEEQDVLLRVLDDFSYSKSATRLLCKLQFLLPNIGDACRHSAHIPEAPGQGGTHD